MSRTFRRCRPRRPAPRRSNSSILADAAEDWYRASGRLEARADALLAAGDTDSATASRAIARINTALMKQERALTTEVGMPGRPWFRHQIYAPGLVTGYAVQYLPGMRDAVEQDKQDTVQTYRDLLLDSLREATRLAERGAGS